VCAGRRSGDAWRQFSFSEFFANNNMWQTVRVLNSTHHFKVHQWCTAQHEVFDILTDPFELTNIATTARGQALARESLPMAKRLGKCSGNSCRHPEAAVPRSSTDFKGVEDGPLPCYVIH